MEQKEIRDLVRQMTLEEKASLLSGADFWHTKAVERLGIRPIMMSDGPYGLRKQDEKADHLGVNDSIKAVCFPAGCTAANSFDRGLMRRMGEALGRECQHEGIALSLGPAINIKRSPLCGRNFEYLSEDPYLAGEMAASMISGLQSKGVGACVKHFAANSQEHRRLSSDSTIDERTLREIYLPAFEAAVKKGKTWTVMCSYNRVNGEFASQNRFLLTDLLRGEWGFDGYVVSDWGAVSDRVKGVEAGLDLEMPSSRGENDALIVQAVREGRLDEGLVDRCVERILKINARCLENAKPETPWDMEADHALSGQIAAECMVLLKNDDAVLPLRHGEKVAVIGEMAVRARFQGGGSSHVNCFKVTSLMDALQGEQGIEYARGYSLASEEPDEALQAEAAALAAKCDKALVVIGLPESYESEGYDRRHMRFPKAMNQLVEAVAKANCNTIVLCYNGAPVEMPWADCVKGILEGYLGGQNLGYANRAVLYGDVNPSGRLAETFPLRLQDTPCYLNYGGEGDRAVYSEGVFVGYRYYNQREMPVRFPFGYGLSYTSFACQNLHLSADTLTDRETLTVSVDVTNTGTRFGKEVVQLYVSDRESTVFRPIRELKGFEKVALDPGETKTVTFTLDKRAFAWWNTELHDWYVETGDFEIQIAKDCRRVQLAANVHVTGTAHVPVRFDKDSIIMDIARHPKAYEAYLREKKPAMFEKERSEAAAEAITEEMNAAMANYGPLRNDLSFGRSGWKEINDLIDRLNEAER